MGADTFARVLMIFGAAVVVIGGLIWLISRLGFPVGQLPGDISVQGENSSFYFPIVSSIVISILLTVIINVVLWLMRK